MSTHYDDELTALLNGELSGDDMRAVVAHLRECGPCTSELISVAVAHGALRAARRSMMPGMAMTAESTAATPAPLPPLVAPIRRRTQWIAAAAAVLVVAFGAAGWLSRPSSTTPSTPVAAVASLHHMDSPAAAAGDVVVHATAKDLVMLVSTKGLPAAPANHFYEVWLLAPSTNKMLPLGVLSATGKGTYTISPSIMNQFSAIDVSLQDNDGIPQHSKTSVLRGDVKAV